MDLQSFSASLTEAGPPAGLSPALEALWCEAKGDWDQAHRRAQNDGSEDGAWVHAYLHRVEGDSANAAYWYRRAGRPVPKGPQREEWAAIAEALLAKAVADRP
jgi:hypothetical protein